MRRAKGTRKLETVKVEGIGEADIYIELDKGQFYFYPGKHSKRIEFDTLEKVRNAAKNALASRGHLVWTPVIEIETGKSSENYLHLDYDRFFLAKRKDGDWLKCPWDEPEGDRVGSSQRFTVYHDWEYRRIKIPMHLFPKKDEDDRAYHLMPFSEEMWAGLQMLTTKLLLLSQKIDALLNSEEGRKMIEDRAERLLPFKEDKA